MISQLHTPLVKPGKDDSGPMAPVKRESNIVDPLSRSIHDPLLRPVVNDPIRAAAEFDQAGELKERIEPPPKKPQSLAEIFLTKTRLYLFVASF